MIIHLPVMMGYYISLFGPYNNYAESIMDKYNALDPKWGVTSTYQGTPISRYYLQALKNTSNKKKSAHEKGNIETEGTTDQPSQSGTAPDPRTLVLITLSCFINTMDVITDCYSRY